MILVIIWKTYHATYRCCWCEAHSSDSDGNHTAGSLLAYAYYKACDDRDIQKLLSFLSTSINSYKKVCYSISCLYCICLL